MTVAAALALTWVATGVTATLLAPRVEPLIETGAAAPALGAAGGTALFVALARRPLALRALASVPGRRAAARTTALTLKSFQEEAVWRGVVLGGLIPLLGAAAALVVSTALFAGAHVAQQGRRAIVHLATGAVFGGAYVLTGRLAAPVAAHAAYNTLVGLAALTMSVSATGRGPKGSLGSSAPRARVVRRRDAVDAVSVQPPVARLEGARKAFGAAVALDTVDLELRPGEILGLLGPNGAGKSTAVALLLGLRRPDAGRAVLFGDDPHRVRSRRSIGVALQDVSFPPTLRVRELLELVRAHHADPEHCDELLERSGLEALARRQAGGLSGGERRRLAIALALVGRPRALFLDEPTAGMDASGRRALWRELAAYAASGGAVLLTTQQLNEAEELATRLVVLVRGRVVFEGSVTEVRARAGKARVSFRAERVPALPPGALVESYGARHVVFVEDADRFVGELVRSGVGFGELEITRVSLEDGLLALTRGAS